MTTPRPLDAPLSLSGRLLKPLAHWLIRAVLHHPDVVEARRRVERLCAITLPALGSRYSAATLASVPVEWVDHGPGQAGAVLLYLHGGAYVLGSPRTHRAITTRFARDAGVRVAALDYRLAPEHPFPAALDDALAAYCALLDAGLPASRLAVAGDSAGGGLTLALALALKARGLPQPAALVCISPWTDLSLGGESITAAAAREVVLSAPLLKTSAARYAGGQALNMPLISPAFGDLSGLPPLLIQVGGQEILLSDALNLHVAARAAGLDASLQQWSQCWHVFHLHAGLMPEANQAIALAAAFVGSKLNVALKAG